MSPISEIDKMLELLNISEDLLRFNSEVESEIVNNGGTVIYSYNNIIIASEISEEYYIELQKNIYVDYIQPLPLKKYGEVSDNLINQINISNL
jgi:hypothetical protein